MIAATRNTIAKHDSKIQQRNAIAKHDSKTRQQNTIVKHDSETRQRNTIAKHNSEARYQNRIAKHKSETQQQNTIAKHDIKTGQQNTKAKHDSETHCEAFCLLQLRLFEQFSMPVRSGTQAKIYRVASVYFFILKLIHNRRFNKLVLKTTLSSLSGLGLGEQIGTTEALKV